MKIKMFAGQVLHTDTDDEIRVLEVFPDGSFTAHWMSNWNLNGDFATELMKFNPDGTLDTKDKDERNQYRIANGLMPIK